MLMVMGALTIAWPLLATGTSGGDKQDRREKRAKGAARGSKYWPAPERVRHTGVKGPSGIAFHPTLGHLFSIGDMGTLVELDGQGNRIRSVGLEAQLEDVTVAPDGGLLLVSESRSELILLDARNLRERKRWVIDRPAVLGTAAGPDPNQGFEGVFFQSRSGGASGRLLLAHQDAPAMVTVLAFDPGKDGGLGAKDVLARWPLPEFHDLRAITYAPSLDRFLVVAGKKGRLLILGPEGHVEASLPIPGVAPEGLCLDPEGALWLADDVGDSVLRIAGALDVISSHLPESAPRR